MNFDKTSARGCSILKILRNVFRFDEVAGFFHDMLHVGE